MSERKLKVGCCGFAAGMDAYFQRFDLVEIQKTFYSPQSERTLASWRRKAPANFNFSIKAWQAITHHPSSPTWKRCPEKLRPSPFEKVGEFKPNKIVFEAWRQVLRWTKQLRSETVVFQTPSSFKPTLQSASNMEAFFTSIERRGLTLCWEPRGKWLEERDQLCAMLDKLDLVHVVDPFWDKPQSSVPYFYFRLHGLGRRYNYRYDYKMDDLEILLTIIQKYLNRGIVRVLFNNVNMLSSAENFKRRLMDVQVLSKHPRWPSD